MDSYLISRVALSDKSGTAYLKLLCALPPFSRFVLNNKGLTNDLLTRFTDTLQMEDTIIYKLPYGAPHRSAKDAHGKILPAILKSNNSGKEESLWMYMGNLHRVDKDENGLTLPAEIRIHNGVFNARSWYENGQPHRIDKDKNGNGYTLPSTIIVENGKVVENSWYFKGIRHRADMDVKTKKYLPALVYKEHDYWVSMYYYWGYTVNIFNEVTSVDAVVLYNY